jgi:hypothetical protein
MPGTKSRWRRVIIGASLSLLAIYVYFFVTADQQRIASVTVEADLRRECEKLVFNSIDKDQAIKSLRYQQYRVTEDGDSVYATKTTPGPFPFAGLSITNGAQLKVENGTVRKFMLFQVGAAL